MRPGDLGRHRLAGAVQQAHPQRRRRDRRIPHVADRAGHRQHRPAAQEGRLGAARPRSPGRRCSPAGRGRRRPPARRPAAAPPGRGRRSRRPPAPRSARRAEAQTSTLPLAAFAALGGRAHPRARRRLGADRAPGRAPPRRSRRRRRRLGLGHHRLSRGAASASRGFRLGGGSAILGPSRSSARRSCEHFTAPARRPGCASHRRNSWWRTLDRSVS